MAARCIQSRQASIGRPSGSGITKSMIIVVPPASAAAGPVKKSSVVTVPMKGSSMWVWRVDPARHHQRTAGVDDLGARRRLQPLAHGLDRAVLAVDVRPPGFVGGDHRGHL